jgi:AIPR protein
VSQVNNKDLKAEIEDMRERFPNLKADDLFVAWFMKCFVTNTEQDGIASLVGGANDKSLDAVHIDDSARKVFIVQGKYRQKTNGGTEKRSDVLAFGDLARSFTDDEAFRAYCKGLAVAAAGKAEEARKRIKGRDYRLQLYFVTTGKCSPALVKEAKSIVHHNSACADIEIIDGNPVLRLLSDYLDGVAPPVPLLELEIESGNGVTLSGILQRFDKQTKIESWVVPVAVDQIARMYDSAGIRLFARNVRGYLGSNTQINRSLKETLDTEPTYFWYYNNGVTIVCDSAEHVSKGGKKLLRLELSRRPPAASVVDR